MTDILKQKALRLSYFTVGYMVVECLVSLLAAYLAGSIALLGFGLDSMLECLSGGVMIWRFYPHPDLSAEDEARLEQQAVKVIGYLFFFLAAYIFYESAEKLIYAKIPRPSLLGIFVALSSIIVMPALYLVKFRTGKSLDSASLKADSKQTLTCALLSVALLISLGLNYLFGLWQSDPALGLLISVFLVEEGRHALKEGKLCNCAACGLPPGHGELQLNDLQLLPPEEKDGL